MTIERDPKHSVPAEAVRTMLRREESYAVHALIYMWERPGASAAQIARDLQMPAAFTAKVLRRLVQTGLVASRKGRSGGVHILAPLDQLTILDVVEAVSGPVVMDTCETKTACPTRQRKGHCRLNFAWMRLTGQVRTALGEVRLSELVDAPAEAPHSVGGVPPTA